MIAQVRAALAAIVGAKLTLQRASGAGRTFELYIMTGVAQQLKNRGLPVWLQRSDGTRIRPGEANRRFVQRDGPPTGVRAAAEGAGNPSVIVFKSNLGSTWEIWNGIQFRGRSLAKHEIDIAVVPGAVGKALRSTGGVPDGRPRVAIECKDVATACSPDEMRAFLARLYDLTFLRGHVLYLSLLPAGQVIYPGNLGPGTIHKTVVTYRQSNRRAMSVIARRSGFSRGALDMKAYYAIDPRPRITSTSPNAPILLDIVASWIVKNCS